jgi:undecaprenyl diphosphate synthase
MKLFSRDQKVEPQRLPQHLAIIMDGNGRWAKKRGLPRSAGHTVGANNFRTITRYCSKIGIRYLTVYAFSTENWNRPQDEVHNLMRLFKQYLEEAIRDFKDDDIRIIFLGDQSAFSPDLRSLIRKTEEAGRDRTGMVLNIAMNYGGRDEILMAAKKLAQEVQSGEISIDQIDGRLFSNRLYTAGQPDVDLIIRPSGENRLSNFLLWQSAYAEFISMNVLWPDFKTSDLDKALLEFSMRNRRFGGI